MSRLLFWAFSTVGLWASFWRCRAILLYPENTLFQFTLGISMPVAMTKRGGIAFSAGFQLNYALPWNLTQFEPTIIPARHVRDLDLQGTYVAIENLLDEHGWQDGRQCLLRTICELAETPLRRTQRDVLGEVIHLILTPTEDLPVAINSSHQSANKLYQEAERLALFFSSQWREWCSCSVFSRCAVGEARVPRRDRAGRYCTRRRSSTHSEEHSRRGIDGRECLKKSICEAATTPLADEGLVGELLHLLLTPRKSDTASDSEYLQALEFGRDYHDCSRIYKSCLPGQGILDQISKLT
ncbi:PREDICTED: uncharacterized protein LOC105453119 [Wasmannia auropunctata]|uniref:uncharacterized protein LOC105453119 n=1 Tax=Wasmannia auropunctata TaxID=64793 RepID=UPI0005EFF5BA|nr:PREDICTED: uncharacterized protein LOC105453119 [Wasmannia auropunctata]